MKQIPKYKEVSKKYSNMNVEVGEKTLLPTGLLVDHGGDKHSEGGTDVNLPEGSMIFSNAMKLDKNVVALLLNKDKAKVKRMTPAELAKKYATNELLENIESPDKYKANSAKLMLEKNIAQLNSIFQAQEEHKKVNGIESGKTLAEQGMKAEYGTAKYGGVAQNGDIAGLFKSYLQRPQLEELPHYLNRPRYDYYPYRDNPHSPFNDTRVRQGTVWEKNEKGQWYATYPNRENVPLYPGEEWYQDEDTGAWKFYNNNGAKHDGSLSLKEPYPIEGGKWVKEKRGGYDDWFWYKDPNTTPVTGSYNLNPVIDRANTYVNTQPKTNAISLDQMFKPFNYGVTSPILPEDMDMYEAYQASEQANADKQSGLFRPRQYTVLPTGQYVGVGRDLNSGKPITFDPSTGIGTSQNKKQLFGFPSGYVNDGVVKNENIGKFLDEQVSFDRASGKYDLSTPENIGKNQQVLQHLVSGDYDHIPAMNAYKDHYTVIVSDGKQKYRVKGSTSPTDPALLALPEIDSASVLSNLNNYTVELPSPDGKIANAFGHNWNYDDGINIFDTQTNFYEPGANIKEFSVGDPKTWANQTPVKSTDSTTPEVPKKPMTDYAIKSHNQIAADLYRKLFSAEMQAPYEIFNPGIAPVVRPAYQSTAPVQQALNNLSYTLDNSNASTQYGNALYADGLAKSLESSNQISRYNQQAAMEAEQKNTGNLVNTFNQNQQGFAANANANNINFLKAKDRYEHYKDDLFSRVLENQVDRNTYEGMLQDRRLTERYSPSELLDNGAWNNFFDPQRYMQFDNKDTLNPDNGQKLASLSQDELTQLKTARDNETDPTLKAKLWELYLKAIESKSQSGGYLKKKGSYQVGGISDNDKNSNEITQNNSNLNWIQRGLFPEKYPYLTEGSDKKTHRLATAGFDDGTMVFPTIVQNKDRSLVEFDIDKALDYAMKTNTGVMVKDPQLADYYSKNGLIKHYQTGVKVTNYVKPIVPLQKYLTIDTIVPQQVNPIVSTPLVQRVKQTLFPSNIVTPVESGYSSHSKASDKIYEQQTGGFNHNTFNKILYGDMQSGGVNSLFPSTTILNQQDIVRKELQDYFKSLGKTNATKRLNDMKNEYVSSNNNMNTKYQIPLIQEAYLMAYPVEMVPKSKSKRY